MRFINFLLKKSEHLVNKCFLFTLFLLIIGISNTSFGQSKLSAGVNYIAAFGEKTIDFQNTEYFINTSHGYEITLNNSYHFRNTKIQGVFEIGFRQLNFSGSSDNLIYSGQVIKLIGALGANYSFNDKWDVATYVEVENNLGLDEFNSGTGDLFRISLSLETKYFLTDHLGISLLMSRAMTPITNGYIILNPQYQTRLGLIYKFL
jgi:hypothetical protein